MAPRRQAAILARERIYNIFHRARPTKFIDLPEDALFHMVQFLDVRSIVALYTACNNHVNVAIENYVNRNFRRFTFKDLVILNGTPKHRPLHNIINNGIANIVHTVKIVEYGHTTTDTAADTLNLIPNENSEIVVHGRANTIELITK